MTAALFVVAAGGGAVVRYLVNQVGLGWIGTWCVNVIGAFVLGLLIAGDPDTATATVVGTGLLGGLTTFSTFALEATEGPTSRRVAVVAATLTAGLAAGALGYALG